MDNRHLEQMIGENETLLWEGRPRHFLYTLLPLPLYLMALVWLLVDLSFLRLGHAMIVNNDARVGGFPLPLVFVGFLLLHLLPVWLAFFATLYRFFAWYALAYAITDHRVYVKSGLIGADYRILRMDEIHHLSLKVGLFERLCGAGTLRLTPEQSCSENASLYSAKNFVLVSIPEPERIYKLLRERSLDMTTDYNYPNALRPETNPGYQTKYRDDRGAEG